MVEAGTQRISFTGGEPLLRDDMGEIVNYAKKKGLYVTLSSNGSFLPEKMDDVKNVDALILTLDGSSAHDRYRKKGSYNQLINAIKILKANNINVWTTTVLNNYSINDIDEILRFAKELDIKTYFAPLMQIPKLTGVIDELFPTIEKQKESINKIIKRKKEGYPILNSYDFLYYINKWPDYTKSQYINEKLPESIKIKCVASDLFCHINTNGNLYSCINRMYQTKGYNVLKLGFKNAFEKSSRNGCNACRTFSFVELNLIFNLRFGAIYNMLKAN